MANTGTYWRVGDNEIHFWLYILQNIIIMRSEKMHRSSTTPLTVKYRWLSGCEMGHFSDILLKALIVPRKRFWNYVRNIKRIFWIAETMVISPSKRFKSLNFCIFRIEHRVKPNHILQKATWAAEMSLNMWFALRQWCRTTARSCRSARAFAAWSSSLMRLHMWLYIKTVSPLRRNPLLRFKASNNYLTSTESAELFNKIRWCRLSVDCSKKVITKKKRLDSKDRSVLLCCFETLRPKVR